MYYIFIMEVDGWTGAEQLVRSLATAVLNIKLSVIPEGLFKSITKSLGVMFEYNVRGSEPIAFNGAQIQTP